MDAALPQAIGNYRVVSKLGQGGMGAVYHAVQGTLERPCALKILPPELSMNHEYVTRFLREARSVAQLRHENIVQVYDAGQEGLNYFIAMELIDGCDLQSYIEKKGQISEAEGLKLLLQASKGLAAAHAKGLVHRDIKPQNLLMGNDGMLRIVDFGLVMEATSTTQLTATGACLGTPMYMSPEQADGETADARTDVYSLGVTFFRVFTGQLPFVSNTVMNLLFKHKFEAPPDPKGLRSELSENVRRLLLHMIAKQRENRPQDGSKIVEMIEAIQAGKSLPPPPVQTVHQAGGTSIITPSSAVTGVHAPSTTRSKLPLIAAGVGMALVIALLVVFMSAEKKNENFVSAETAFEAGRYKEAAESYKLVLAAEPENSAAKEKLARAEAAVKSAELFEAAAALERAGNLASAAARYQDAAAIDTTGKAKAEFERVKALIEKNQVLSGNQREADRDRYSKLAADAERVGNFESAAENYSHAAQLAEPPLKGVLADKAQECRRQSYVAAAVREEQRGNLAESETQYRRALEIKRDPLVEQQLADVLKKKNQNTTGPLYDAAMKDGQLRLDAGDYAAARAKFSEAQTIKQGDAVAGNKLRETEGRESIAKGDALLTKGEKAAAIKLYTEAIEKWPPLGLEATQRIQTANTKPATVPATNTTVETVPAKGVFVPPNTPPSAASGTITKVELLVRDKRDSDALQELLNALRVNPTNKELSDCRAAFDSLQATGGIYGELLKISANGKTRVDETLEISDESRIRETGEKLEEHNLRFTERRDEVRSQFLKKDYAAVHSALRSSRADASDIAATLQATATWLEQRAEKAADGSGIKLFGGLRLGSSGDKKKSERFRTAGEGFARLAEQARAQSK